MFPRINVVRRVAYAATREAALEERLFSKSGPQPCAALSYLDGAGIPISAAGGRCVGKRQGVENLNKRLRTLEAQGARESHMLTEAQLAAFEKAQGEKEAHGEFESEGPGYGGAQDTFFVGTLKVEAGLTCRPSSIPPLRWPLPSCTIARRR